MGCLVDGLGDYALDSYEDVTSSKNQSFSWHVHSFKKKFIS